MQLASLILVLQILGSTWSNAEHRFSENGFDPSAWVAQYASRPRSIQDNIYFNTTTTNTSEQIPDVFGTEPTASPFNEKAIVSALLRYGQHHKYVLKTILRGLKLLRESSISDIRQCVDEALSQHATEYSVVDQDEEKRVVKALITEPNYMEFCVQRTAHKNMQKQVYDSVMTEISSVIKSRQLKQHLASTSVSSTTSTAAEPVEVTTTLPITSMPADLVEKVETTTMTPTVASTDGELQETSTTPNTESYFKETDSTPTPLGLSLSREDMNTALNEEILADGFLPQIRKQYQPYTKIPSRIPLIYHHGSIFAPGLNHLPHPYISIFSVGEIDPEVLKLKSFPVHYPEPYRAQVTNEETLTTTTQEFVSNTETEIEDNESSTPQAIEATSDPETLRSVKKMLDDDQFLWPGPFAMERQRVVRSPTKFSLDVPSMEDAQDMAKNSRAPKEYVLPLKSEAIPVFSVPGEIPDLGKEINVIKEFSEPASTAEPPIVLKVQRVPTHVDTSEFWNTREDDREQEVSEEPNIGALLDDLRTTDSSVMRESKMLKEQPVTDSLFEHSDQTITTTEMILETSTATQENNKTPSTEGLFSKEDGESSNESASNESVSSSEEEQSNEGTSSEVVDEAAVQNYTEQSVTEITSETSTSSEESTTKADTITTVESLTETSDKSTESASTTITDESGLYITDKPTADSTHIDSVFAETTTVNPSTVSDITDKPIGHTLSATPVTSSESSKPSAGATWDPDFDFVVEEFSSSHIAKDDIQYEYMDYPLSLLGELAKSLTDLTARSTSSQVLNETRAFSPTAKLVEDGSTADSNDSGVTRDEERVLTSFQDDAKQKELSGSQQKPVSVRSRRQVKLPSAVLKLLKDKGLDPETALHRHGSSASANQIPASPQKFPKSRTQKILFSLSDKRRKCFDEDAENETDSDNEDASILELIDVNRVSNILDKKQKKA